jgi:hypothetical protein
MKEIVNLCWYVIRSTFAVELPLLCKSLNGKLTSFHLLLIVLVLEHALMSRIGVVSCGIQPSSLHASTTASHDSQHKGTQHDLISTIKHGIRDETSQPTSNVLDELLTML